MTLGVRALVIDEQEPHLSGQAQLRSGWHLPGGGVEAGETLAQALARELREEGNIELTGAAAAARHVLQRSRPPGATMWRCSWCAISASRRRRCPITRSSRMAFSRSTELPNDTTAGTRARIVEVLGGAPVERALVSALPATESEIVSLSLRESPIIVLSGQRVLVDSRAGVQRGRDRTSQRSRMMQRARTRRCRVQTSNIASRDRSGAARRMRHATSRSPAGRELVHVASCRRPRPASAVADRLLRRAFAGLVLVALSGALLIGLAVVGLLALLRLRAFSWPGGTGWIRSKC